MFEILVRCIKKEKYFLVSNVHFVCARAGDRTISQHFTTLRVYVKYGPYAERTDMTHKNTHVLLLHAIVTVNF